MTRDQSDNDRRHSLCDDEPQDVHRLRAERHAHADFAGALLDRVSDRAVNSNHRQDQRDRRRKHRSSVIVMRRWPNDWSMISSIVAGLNDRQPGSTLVERRAHDPGGPLPVCPLS